LEFTPIRVLNSDFYFQFRTKISFKTGAATAVTVTPFYTLKPELPPKSPMLGSSDLLTAYDLGAVYSRYCGAKRMREDLNSFLPQIYGNFNFSQAQDISSLKMLVEKPPITGKEINTLSSTAMSGFRLTPGPVDEKRKDFGVGQRYKNSLDSLDGECGIPLRDFLLLTLYSAGKCLYSLYSPIFVLNSLDFTMFTFYFLSSIIFYGKVLSEIQPQHC
uniref:Mediator of RNA polymerase II transcription subunit 19 n=1 Tax=Angiostrongylus costaricensis TaxID=334426 RepID=A0A0R3PNP6_ANGCS